MKTLYLDCGMGAAGDMLTAALLELLPDRDAFLQQMNALGIPGVEIKEESVSKCGIKGTHISVTVHGEEEESEDVCAHEHEHGHGHHHEHGGHSCICESNGAYNHEHEDHEHTCDHDESHHDHAHGHAHEEHHHGHDAHGHHHDHADHTHGEAGHSHSHHHSSMHDIEHIITGHLQLPKEVQQDVLSVYNLIAEAESHAHGVPVSEIHFHEVGNMDAIADVTAVCLLMHMLAPDEIVVSPIHVGSGQVRCAHGILPVPAPATAYILREAPIYSGSIRGELCTPTGAALLKHFATRFGAMPVMKVSAIGYGMGKKDFEAANCVRAMLGESGDRQDTITDLSCNVDDMTAEAVGFCMEQLFAGGALEVFTVPVNMKKSRPGTLIHVLCKNEDKEKIVSLIFKHTTTIGIRETVCNRYVLQRRMETCETPFGEVRRKVSSGYGVEREKYEYDDLSRIARENDMSLTEVVKKLEEE